MNLPIISFQVCEALKECQCGAASCSGFMGEKSSSHEHGEVKESPVPSRKRGRKRRPSLSLSPPSCLQVWEEQCFICLETGNLLRCDHSSCSKAYHPLCVSLQQTPPAPWLCPWHSCAQCSLPAEAWCRHCPNAFCAQHNSLSDELGLGQLCDEHMEELAFLREDS